MSDNGIIDSRRLTGPNLWADQPGAILDVELPAPELARTIAGWRLWARRILDRLGWHDSLLFQRIYEGGANLVMTAPLDALYAATEINEWAWHAARAEVTNHRVPGSAAADDEVPDTDAAAIAFAGSIAAEARPALLALREAARRHGVAFFCDDDLVSVGMGRFGRTWARDALPDPATIDWADLSDIPAALITGTNGKSTTVRLLGAMARAASRRPGLCSTDWIMVGDEIADQGDFSGPGGMRRVLRDERIDIAFLEAARGGILRRGLGIDRVRAALVTNVAEDHLGEYGIQTVADLAHAKLVVAKAIVADGRLVLNADDPLLSRLGGDYPQTKIWFALDPANETLYAHAQTGGDACFVENGKFVLQFHGVHQEIMAVADAPITLAGAARFNIANALGAIAVAAALGLPIEAIRTGLTEFANTPQTNPGRLNLIERNGVKMLIDFAHNPHGMAALMAMAAALPAKRKLVILGQAGDREDQAIRKLAQLAWQANPDLIIIKEMPAHLRGRRLGEVPALLEDELRACGAPSDRIRHADTQMQAIEAAIAWSQPGDLLLLIIHHNRDEVFTLLEAFP